MRLVSLRLEHFRQFYGTQELFFAGSDPARNVTVVHGHNGSGKTALLNAFVWCLYGDTTPDLEEPERLENERAIAEAAAGSTIRVSVRLGYEEGGDTFFVERSREVTKESDTSVRRGAVNLEMWRIPASGATESIGQNPDERQKRVNNLLPKSLYPFFFFNGERVERLSRPDAFDQVETGVKTLLDVEIFERTVRHLRGPVAGDLSKELKDIGGEEARELVEQQEAALEKKSQAEATIEEARQKAKDLLDEIAQYEKKQAEIAELSELTRRRDVTRDKRQRVDSDLAETDQDLYRAFSSSGYLAFAESIFSRTSGLVDDARLRGEIPAKIKPQFVDDLLLKGECVCGRPLGPGSPEEASLLAWKGTTGLAALEEAISKTAAMFRPLRQRRTEYFSQVEILQSRRSQLLSDRTTLDAEESLIQEQLGDRSHGEDAAGLAGRIRKLQADLGDCQVSVKVAQVEVAKLDEQLHDLREKLKKVKANNDRAALLKRQMEVVDRIADAVERIFEIKKESVRKRLDEQIREIVADSVLKDYRASVTQEYRLLLTKTVGDIEQPVYGPSTGERQVLSLAFVGSLVRAAAENLSDSGTGGIGPALGGLYPLIMDSPFGMLEETYRQKVAEWVPRLAHQVVVLVSNTQWRGEAETAMQSRIAREYVLELHTAKQNTNLSIAVRDRKLPYVISSSDPYEYTLVREVQ